MMNNKNLTKDSYEHTICTLKKLTSIPTESIQSHIETEILELEKLASLASPDMTTSVLESHQVLCKVKDMDEKAAFGQDPAIFYGLAMSGECGELANNLIKAIRSGGSALQKQKAILDELPDVLIYAILLAYTNNIDHVKAVAEKAVIVAQRARDGYYGGILK